MASMDGFTLDLQLTMASLQVCIRLKKCLVKPWMQPLAPVCPVCRVHVPVEVPPAAHTAARRPQLLSPPTQPQTLPLLQPSDGTDMLVEPTQDLTHASQLHLLMTGPDAPLSTPGLLSEPPPASPAAPPAEQPVPPLQPQPESVETDAPEALAQAPPEAPPAQPLTRPPAEPAAPQQLLQPPQQSAPDESASPPPLQQQQQQRQPRFSEPNGSPLQAERPPPCPLALSTLPPTPYSELDSSELDSSGGGSSSGGSSGGYDASGGTLATCNGGGGASPTPQPTQLTQAHLWARTVEERQGARNVAEMIDGELQLESCSLPAASWFLWLMQQVGQHMSPATSITSPLDPSTAARAAGLSAGVEQFIIPGAVLFYETSCLVDVIGRGKVRVDATRADTWAAARCSM